MRRRRVLGAALGGGALLLGLAAWAIDRAGQVDDAAPADALVVLGARVEPSGAPSPTLRARVEHAVALYRRGLAPKLVFSGGVGDFGGSEAQVAARLAIALGVPPTACLLEEGSHSTAQNAAFTAALLKREGLFRVVLVTDPYHLPRARRLFAGAGVSATGSPVLRAPRHQALPARLFWTLREVPALLRSLCTPAAAPG